MASVASGSAAAVQGVDLVSGKLVTEKGKPVGNASVALLIAPEPQAHANLKVGTRQQFETVSTVTSAADGSYELSVPKARAVALSKLSTIPDFQVVALDGNSIGVSGFSRKLVARPKASSFAVADFKSQQTGALRLPLTMHAAITAPASVSAASEPLQPGISCTRTLLKNYGVIPVQVGLLSVATTHVKATFKYLEGASSELGFGISLTGGDTGSFKLGGTTTDEADASQSFPQISSVKTRAERTGFRYALFHVNCARPRQSNQIYDEATDIGWAGGDYSKNAKAPKGPACIQEHKGDAFSRHSTKATTVAGGVELKKLIGVNLSADTGFTTDASESFTFSATRKMCGTKGYPGASNPAPGTLVAITG